MGVLGRAAGGDFVREFQSARFWIAANVAGTVAFLWLASQTWIEPELRGEDVARGGDGIVWAFTALPMIAAFLVLDLVWLARVAAKIAKTKTSRSAWPLSAAGLLWIFAVMVDLAFR